MNPKVSIIIPTYNRADLLSRAIKSALNQTFKDFELIVVDDGSTDNTRQVVEGFQQKDERIKYIWQENSGAPAKPKNTGIENSKGEYVAFLDSDDEFVPEKIEKQLNLFLHSKKENLGFVGCNVLIIQQGNIIQEYITPKYKEVFLKLLESNFILSSSSVLVKKEVFENIGLHDIRFKCSEDWDMWIRIAQKYNFDFVPEFLFKYYVHSLSITQTTPTKEKTQDLLFILEKHKKQIIEKWPHIYGTHLRHLGSINLLSENKKDSMKCFIQSIKIYPSPRNILTMILSLLGKKIYYHLLNFKRKIAGNLFTG